MRIGYLGDGAWARYGLELLHADPAFSVAFVVPRFHTPDERLVQQATGAGIDVLRIANVNAAEGLRRLGAYGVDLLVSMSFDQILRTDVLNLCPQGAVNCHAGALPFYRGRNVLNWVLINDESEFGVTVHFMDEGIDTGDIILQRMAPITDNDTYGTLLDRATRLCAETLHEGLRHLADGSVRPVPQHTIDPVGFYTGGRLPGDEWIDWRWPSRRIFNFVRAITTPGPCARTIFDGTDLKVVSAAMIPGAPDYIGTPGEVVGHNTEGVQVKTGDSTLMLTGLEASTDVELRIGHRLLSPYDEMVRQALARPFDRNSSVD